MGSNVCGFLDSCEYVGVFQSPYRHSPTFQAFCLIYCLSQLFVLPKVTGKSIDSLSFIVFENASGVKAFALVWLWINQMKTALQVRSSREPSVRWNCSLRITFWRHSNLIQPHSMGARLLVFTTIVGYCFSMQQPCWSWRNRVKTSQNITKACCSYWKI